MKKIFIIPLLFLNFLLPDLLSADQSSVFSVGEDIPIDTRDEMGRTALMRAVWMDNSEAVSRLLSSGADPNLKDKNGQTPLYFALQFSENESLLSLLLNSGAEVDTVDNRGRSPYEILINRGIYPHFMSQLLQYGDLPKESSQGESLFFAAL
ncbi:ankyrin repeat domain-containing protein, partial [Oceanispirochaeta sp.]|uniref:ankyrin repeat domain-containing protein n=1 Tax=Oceanispirochaeta sp. TaxID=2035350 RepID=UPI002615C1AB